MVVVMVRWDICFPASRGGFCYVIMMMLLLLPTLHLTYVVHSTFFAHKSLVHNTHTHTHTHTHPPSLPPSLPHLEGPLVRVRAHVHVEGGGVGELLQADVAAEAGPVARLAQRAADVRQDVLLQHAVGGEAPPAAHHRALERRLARVGEPVEVQALLGHAAVAAQVALDLEPEETKVVVVVVLGGNGEDATNKMLRVN